MPLPSHGQHDWDDELNNFIAAIQASADSALANSSGAVSTALAASNTATDAQSNAGDAKTAAETARDAAVNASQLVGAPADGAIAAVVGNDASATKAALSATYVAVVTPQKFGAKGDGVTDDTAAINAAIAALTPGATLAFPPGRYMTNGGHVIDKPSVKIVGPSGRAQTYNSSAQLYLRTGANADMLTVPANQVTIRDLSLYGNKTNQTAPSRGLVTPNTAGASYFLFDAVWVDSFNGDGFSLDSSGTLSGTIIGCESRVNNGYGMHFYGGATDTMVSDCYIDQNVQSGVFIQAGDISLTSCHIWGNGTGSTGDLDGITLQSAGGCRIVNCYVETNRNGAGIRFKSGTNRGHIVQGCDIWESGLQGIYMFSALQCVISGNIIRTNNFKGGAGSSGAGLLVDSCTACSITGNVFFSASLNRQTYGYYEVGTANADIRFSNNASRAVDHSTGGVFLGPGTRADLGQVVKYKAADSSIASSTAIADDADLQFPVAAGEVWEVEGVLFCEGAQTGDLNIRIGTPAGQTGYWRAAGPNASGTSASASSYVPLAQAYNTTQTIGMLGAGVNVAVKVEGLVTITAAGSLVIRWAQGTSDVTPTIVKAGSYLRGRRVAQ